jgi:choline-glycine betaine transporter
MSNIETELNSKLKSANSTVDALFCLFAFTLVASIIIIMVMVSIIHENKVEAVQHHAAQWVVDQFGEVTLKYNDEIKK